MRGPIGSHVSLVGREGEEHRNSAGALAHRPQPRGCSAFLPSGKPIGYIRLSQFNANATELAHVLARLEQGASLYSRSAEQSGWAVASRN